MNPTVYQVEVAGEIVTVKSFNDAVGVCRGLFRLPGRYIPWKEIDNKTTIVNENITVKVIDIPLSWVKWCPQFEERIDAYKLPKLTPLSI